MKYANFALAIFAAVAITACGGGGSSSPETAQVIPPTGGSDDDGGNNNDDQNTDNRERVWTFAVNEEPIATTVGKEYGSFLGDYHVEDFDNDGRIDILVSGPAWDNTEGSDGWSGDPTRYEVLWGNEDGFVNNDAKLFGEDFTPQMIMGVDIVAEDFDGDGNTDFVISGSGHDVTELAEGDKMEYYRNTGQLPLVDATADLNFDLSAFMHSSTSGDFNGDGFPDVTSWQCCFGPDIDLKETSGVMLLNDGTGEFARNEEMVPEEFAPEYVQNATQKYGSWQILESFAIDLNGSTCDDLVVGGGNLASKSQILWNHCDRRLSTPVLTGNEQTDAFVFPDVEGYAVVLDVVVYPANNDSEPDLLVSRTTDDYDSTYLQHLQNNGDGTFTDVTEDTVTQTTFEAAIGKAHVEDFDGDGYPDIVFRHAMFRGTEQGIEPVDFEANYVYNTLMVADANNDGKTDVLIRHVVPETFGFEDQTIEYTLLENVSE